MAPVLSSVDLVTSDMEASIAFYRALGLKIEPWTSDGAPHHVSIHFDGPEPGATGAELMLNSRPLAKGYAPQARPGLPTVIFNVGSRDEVDERFAALEAAGYDGQQEPFDAFWGARYAIVADPDGIPVGIMSPTDESMRSAPPQV